MGLTQERILIVEDETEIRELITLQLQRDGYVVEAVGTGEQALQAATKNQYDLFVLDWMLPGLSGLEIARYLRQKSSQKTVPILMVTARVAPGDIISGLEAGADDYVSKPFDASVLLARVRALIRRTRLQKEQKDASEVKHLKVGELQMDLDSHEVHCCNEQVYLTPSEFKLLQTLISQSGKVHTREALIQEVQGTGVTVVDRAIDTHIFGLRKKLGACADVIETIRGIGYRVKPIEAQQS